MKLKKLEEYLQCVDNFIKPKIKLEQYITPSHIASHILYMCNSFGDINNKLIADLGSGTGMLSIGAALLEACHVIGFEIDQDAIQIAKANIDEMEIENVDFVTMDINNILLNIDKGEMKCFQNKFDTVLINPPFGTKKNAGTDIQFLKVAAHLAKSTIYSLHKTSTRDYVKRKCADLNMDGSVVAELRYNLDSSYRFHKEASVDISVDLWQFKIK